MFETDAPRPIHCMACRAQREAPPGASLGDAWLVGYVSGVLQLTTRLREVAAADAPPVASQLDVMSLDTCEHHGRMAEALMRSQIEALGDRLAVAVVHAGPKGAGN